MHGVEISCLPGCSKVVDVYNDVDRFPFYLFAWNKKLSQVWRGRQAPLESDYWNRIWATKTARDKGKEELGASRREAGICVKLRSFSSRRSGRSLCKSLSK